MLKKRKSRVSSLISSSIAWGWSRPAQIGILFCGLIIVTLVLLVSDHDSRTEEEIYLDRLGDSHVAHEGFEDAPLLEKLKAIDAALHVAEAERFELAEERARLMKELSFNDTGEEDEYDELDDQTQAAFLYSDRALPSNMSCLDPLRFNSSSGPTCARTPLKLELPYPRIYVYDLPQRFNREMVKKYKRCATDQYGTEVFFHEALLVSELRVRKPEEATMFFVPIYGECYLWQHEMLRRENREKSYELTNTFFMEAMSMVKEKYPFWNRTLGRDHIFVFPGARGPTIFNEWKQQIGNAVYLTPEGDRKATYFNTWKDIVIPGLEADPQFWGQDSRQELITHPPHRRYLAYFRGTIFHREGTAYSRGLRPRLHAIFANQTDIIYNTKQKDCDRKCYRAEMTESVFCLNPLGWTPWTLRFYQAVMTRCIPILIADDIEFPYESELDYSQFALKIPEKDVDNILEIMRGMSEEEREKKRKYMDKLWKVFTYQRPPEASDAFYASMRELARKHRSFKTSSVHAW
eukprot:CAMPEP_0196592856 /NCGR_PEP_ID=MMETSP1081-20130531/74024_1 /TAXON_ID=36882 /ORGANISM="Pyramimonas amylifera, Strain CCMP720" /LENGTH=519 /DNA_ID=CAMNT_0041916667 /DNA_START=82 /DNA_END=1638 /DNA_ORIENTATION=-